MPEAIRPFARALLLCDYVVGYDNGKSDLYGLFNAIRPAAYPHTQGRFCLFAQLAGGLGEVPFHADVIIPHVDGSARICEIVRYQLGDINVKGAWEGPAALELFHHALAPVAALPVVRVLSGTHILSDLTLNLGKVVYDYLAPERARPRPSRSDNGEG